MNKMVLLMLCIKSVFARPMQSIVIDEPNKTTNAIEIFNSFKITENPEYNEYLELLIFYPYFMMQYSFDIKNSMIFDINLTSNTINMCIKNPLELAEKFEIATQSRSPPSPEK
ncbi:hypothetical protein [Candidatus Cytomitobacter primus]|uniref:Uncharacterized protein n=1 Tax=Candidatus Cytomitobacter primus TaxID=2066024 RepID=A0A5C0UFM2_9PROT|nr:hypothetical protein [Candidatus Cytomitobacter primus]QEK38589.1 hypothetical protein FZC34_01540 [Candidatus Cytomitobacter primus]